MLVMAALWKSEHLAATHGMVLMPGFMWATPSVAVTHVVVTVLSVAA